MSKIDQIGWQQTCCAWHGEYAEAQTRDGGVARFKRSEDVPGIVLVCAFGADGQPAHRGDDGAPAYVEMSQAEAEALLA